MRRLQSGIRGMSAVMFATLIFLVPVALMASIQPILLAIVFAVLGVLFLFASLFVFPRRQTARTIGKGILAAAVLLAIIHISGILEPFYRRDGWLVLGMETGVSSLQVTPGDILTYTMSTTTDDARPAMAKRFVVDGQPYKGLLLYSILPTEEGVGFAIADEPMVELIPWEESLTSSDTVYTVVYAQLKLPILNPVNWDWSTTYVEGMDAIGVITSSGDRHSDLGAGEILSLQYSVVVPLDHPAGNIRSARAGLSYRDPMWASYQTHELRFQFDGPVRVVRN